MTQERARGGAVVKVSEFLAIEWSGGDAPVIAPPALSPVIADPTFLFPHETPTKEWYLFAHSAWGICEYRSTDGSEWQYRGIKVRNAMRPFVRRLTDGRFVLLYEKYRPLAMPLLALPGHRRWHSHLELCTSTDLANWSAPEVVVAPDRGWMEDAYCGASVSNPCLLETGGAFRLYFSASLAYVEDCGFCEPRYIAVASSQNVAGPFEVADRPIIDPADDDHPGVIGAGAMKVIELEDGYVGLQNKIYRGEDGRSHSAIFLLTSEDGFAWKRGERKPLIEPDAGWKRSHVYACDARRNERDSRWYLYFNARDGWRIAEGREHIGQIIGSPPGRL